MSRPDPNLVDARRDQGGTKAAPPPHIRKFTRPWEPPAADDVLRARILDVLARVPEFTSDRKGRWHWTAVRQMVGGGVPTARFRAMVDRLIEEGLVVETREVSPRRCQPRHILCLTERWGEYDWGDLIEIHGPAELVATEERRLRDEVAWARMAGPTWG